MHRRLLSQCQLFLGVGMVHGIIYRTTDTDSTDRVVLIVVLAVLVVVGAVMCHKLKGPKIPGAQSPPNRLAPATEEA